MLELFTGLAGSSGRINPDDVGVYEARRLKLLASEKFVNLLGLSKASGVSSSSLYRVVQDKRPMNVWNATKICNVTGVSMDWLMGMTDDKWNGATRQPAYNRPHDANELKRIIRRRLRTAMFESDTSSHELAEQMDVHYVTVNEHLRGRYDLRGGTLVRYCYALNVSADWITGRTNNPACAWNGKAA